MNFNVPQMLESLVIMAKGLIGIFVVISVIWGFVVLLNKVTAKSAQNDEE